ncbi:TetR/AcrR family transcriptional regulator [Notoacmeibacter sp. MSK16QG-6]|uniref:TetR/AcrR family transcriptional regulator n=1 Tax=Notoacmeibacter sp. MSK16QG-6 TaxID=2957982 RepID=UPI00209CF80D|nr:TetR/AcrR family transcriptional regulator [Notoacmeibacter sp. MSK16QG-6]MCP1199001.1 TetR/AcrR family transcriptional regulator [Notoacmeibacter sp. MSK16QG-6]
MPHKTRERILYAALTLFKRRGYHATGVAEILAQANAPKGSLYHHFPKGKPDLACVAVQSLTARILKLFEQAIEDRMSPIEHLSFLCDKCSNWLVRTEFGEGVVISTLGTGLGEPEAQLIETLLRSNREIVSYYADFLRMHKVEQADEVAITVLMTLEGAIVYSRIRRDVAPFRACLATLGPLLQSSEPVAELRQAAM